MQEVKPQEVSKALYQWGAFTASRASGGGSDEHHTAWRKQVLHRSLSSATAPAEVPCSQTSLPSHPRLVTVSEPWELQEAMGAADVQHIEIRQHLDLTAYEGTDWFRGSINPSIKSITVRHANYCSKIPFTV